MRVEDLIEILKELPEDCEVVVVDYDDVRTVEAVKYSKVYREKECKEVCEIGF